MDGQQRRNAAALGVNAADEMAGTLGRDHDDVNVVRRLNGFEVDAEAVRDAQHFAGMKVGLDLRLVEFALGLVGREDLDPVGALGSFVGRDHDHAIGFRLLGRGSVGVEADDDFVSAVAEILCLGVSLTAITQNGDGLALQSIGICIFFVKNCSHRKHLIHDKGDTAALVEYPVRVTEERCVRTKTDRSVGGSMVRRMACGDVKDGRR